MTNKLPPELHLVHGTKGENQGVLIPDLLKKYTPVAYWFEHPDQWDPVQFIRDTSRYLYDVYGIGSDQEQHVLAMLAGHISTYIECEKGIRVTGIITKYNNGKTLGPSPFVSLRDKVTPRIISLMNELGLTPRSRLQGNPSDDIEISELMAGPDRYK
jgi:hypothetical protein